MKTLVLVLGLGLSAVACNDAKPRPAASAAARVGKLSVDELAAQVARGACTPVDANNPTTRAKVGVIPGAVLLTDYETYAAAELPANKARPLVFYCANEQCGASHVAAEKAVIAGYTDVRVMPAGILGWQKAGKQLKTL